MATYEIRITKREPNPDLKDEEKRNYLMYESNRSMDNRSMDNRNYIREEIVKDVLMVELSDEQFKKVKAEVIKAFE